MDGTSLATAIIEVTSRSLIAFIAPTVSRSPVANSNQGMVIKSWPKLLTLWWSAQDRPVSP